MEKRFHRLRDFTGHNWKIMSGYEKVIVGRAILSEENYPTINLQRINRYFVDVVILD